MSGEKPDGLLPLHIGGKLPGQSPLPPLQVPSTPGELSDFFKDRTKETFKLRQERYEQRQEALANAPDLEDVLRTRYKDRTGEDAPEGINLSLHVINNFRGLVKDAQTYRRVSKQAQDPTEKAHAALVYHQLKTQIDQEYIQSPDALSFEKAYREYIRSRSLYVKFLSRIEEVSRLDNLLAEPTFKSLPGDSLFDEADHSRIERVMRSAETTASAQIVPEIDELEKTLKTMYGEGTIEYAEMRRILLATKKEDIPKTKKELEDAREKAKTEALELFKDPMVRRFWREREYDKIIEAFAKGKDVVETQSVIEVLNRMHEWEQQHQRTTIGGVLVGPPGVGKTTLVRHYLDEKGRKYVYMDLSEDVTRYMLYGSKAIEFKTSTEHHKALTEQLASLGTDDFRKFVTENSATLRQVFHLTGDQAISTYLDMLQEELGKSTAEDPQIQNVRARVNDLANQVFRRELAQEFSHLVKRNGWRDGVIINALRRNENVLMDEFNKNKNWSLIYGLMTAKPGEDWYFADNDEYIPIPKDWRMWFTANIGRKHGGFVVAEALASRSQGQVEEIGYPPKREEMMVALSSMADAEGNWLRSIDDLGRLYLLVTEVFPSVRKYIEDRPQSVPISYRTIRQLGETLIQYRDLQTNQPVYRPSNKSFDEAVYEVMVGSYGNYEDKTVPKEIVNICTRLGLMMDDSIKDKVMVWIGKEAYEERKKDQESQVKSREQIIEDFRGLAKDAYRIIADTSAIGMPAHRRF